MSLVKSNVVVSVDCGVCNMGFAVIGFLQNDDGTFDFEVIEVSKVAIGTMRDPIAVVARNLIGYMNSNENLKRADISHVFIEQQLGHAVKNSILSFTAFSYFETLRATQGIELKTKFVPPKQKFEAVRAAFTEPSILEGIDFDRHGRELKKLSVEIMVQLCNKFDIPEGTRALRLNKKKDDVADAFIQAFALFSVSSIKRSSGNPIRTRRR